MKHTFPFSVVVPLLISSVFFLLMLSSSSRLGEKTYEKHMNKTKAKKACYAILCRKLYLHKVRHEVAAANDKQNCSNNRNSGKNLVFPNRFFEKISC